MLRRSNPDTTIASEDAEAFQQDALARLPLMTDIAMGALKALMLINGGAVAGLLTFLGNSPNGHYDTIALKHAFGFFIAGLVLTTFAHIGGYICQSLYYQVSNYQAWDAQAIKHRRPPKWKAKIVRCFRVGAVVEYLSIGAALASLVTFRLGARDALDGIVPDQPSITRPAAPHPISSRVQKPLPPSSTPKLPSPPK